MLGVWGVVFLSSQDETRLGLGRAVELPQLFHALPHAEVLFVEAGYLHNSTLDAVKHDSAESNLTQSEGVSETCVGRKDSERHELFEASAKAVVKLVTEKNSVLDRQLLLVGVLDGVEELVLPAVEFDALDIVEGLVDVEHALLVLCRLLLVDVLLGLAAPVVVRDLGSSEEHHDQAAPAELSRHDVGGSDQVQWAFEIIRAAPNEGPNAVGFAHDDMADFSRGEILVRRCRHAEVLAEEHDFERGVRAVTHLDHLEAEVLPGRVHNHVCDGDHEGQKHHLNRCFDGLRLLPLDPIEHSGDEEGEEDIVELEHDSDDGKLHEVELVGGDESLDEGHSVLSILVDVVSNVSLDVLLLVLDEEAFRQITVLLELDLLVHGTLEEWPRVAVEQLVKEGSVLAHKLALENLVDRLLVFLGRFLFCHLV